MRANVCEPCLIEGKLSLAAWTCKRRGQSNFDMVKFHACHAHKDAFKGMPHDQLLGELMKAENGFIKLQNQTVREAKAVQK